MLRHFRESPSAVLQLPEVERWWEEERGREGEEGTTPVKVRTAAVCGAFCIFLSLSLSLSLLGAAAGFGG